MKVTADGWTRLEHAGMAAAALRVDRHDIAYFKYLFESYEGVAIVRTVEGVASAPAPAREERRPTAGGSGNAWVGGFAPARGVAAVIAILAPPDQVGDAEAILAEVERAGLPAVHRVPLPALCREDWFLETWVGEGDVD